MKIILLIICALGLPYSIWQLVLTIRDRDDPTILINAEIKELYDDAKKYFNRRR